MSASPAKPDALVCVVSPYHLTTQEPPAIGSLQLAERVVTLMPSPLAGSDREHVREAVELSPRYLRFMESWRWSMPLWREGVVASGEGGQELADELRNVLRRIDDEGALAGLRPLMRRQMFENERTFLEAVAGDLLKGGPDPGVTIPVAAGVDAFAARHGLVSVRAGASSVAQKAEMHLGEKIFAIALPMLVRASAGRVLSARCELEPELVALRSAILRSRDAGAPDDALAGAAEAYAAAFDARSEAFLPGDDENGERVQSGYLSVTGVMLPADAVLRSSLVAVRALAKRGSRVGAGASVSQGQAPATAAEPVFSLILRPMNISPAA